jgi:hypothetical protein
VAKQGYLAPNDHGGAGGQVAFSYCRSLYALALMFPPKRSSHSDGHSGRRDGRVPRRKSCESDTSRGFRSGVAVSALFSVIFILWRWLFTLLGGG